MQIPLIANGPLQGPPPMPITGHGVAETNATKAARQDTKDAFGALFRGGDVSKAISQTPKVQGAKVSGEVEEAETQRDITSERVTDENSGLLDPNVQAGSSKSSQVTEAETHRDMKAAQTASAHSVASDSAEELDTTPKAVDRNALPLIAASGSGTEANKTTTTAKLNKVETVFPDQKGPTIIANASPMRAHNRDIPAPTADSAGKIPVEMAKGPPLSASAATAVTKTVPAGANVSKRDQATSSVDLAPVERASEQTVKADRLTVPITPATSAMTIPNLPALVARPHADSAQFAKNLVTEIDASAPEDQPLVFEVRTTGSSTAVMAVPTQALAHRADLPQHIAMQIAAAAQHGRAGGPIDIVLNPAELGPVRLSLASADGVMSVTVIAERPETLDLMRRHIDLLAQEFLNIGYGKTQFSFAGRQFGQPGQEHADGGFSPSHGSDPNAPITEPSNLHHPPILISDRLDIRL